MTKLCGSIPNYETNAWNFNYKTNGKISHNQWIKIKARLNMLKP